jgi:hypothetical protein
MATTAPRWSAEVFATYHFFHFSVVVVLQC